MTTGLSEETLRQHMDASPFIKFCGMELVSANAARQSLVMRMPLKAELERGTDTGQFHGGPIASLIDTAGCFALVMVLEIGVPTINFRTDYLRPAFRTTLTATAVVRRAGKTVGVVDVDVVNDEGKLVALGRGTFGTNPG